MTELQVRSVINNYEDLQKLVETVVKNIRVIRNVPGTYISFYVDGETIRARFEKSDYNEIEFPISYLWTENYDAVERARLIALAETERIMFAGIGVKN